MSESESIAVGSIALRMGSIALRMSESESRAVGSIALRMAESESRAVGSIALRVAESESRAVGSIALLADLPQHLVDAYAQEVLELLNRRSFRPQSLRARRYLELCCTLVLNTEFLLTEENLSFLINHVDNLRSPVPTTTLYYERGSYVIQAELIARAQLERLHQFPDQFSSTGHSTVSIIRAYLLTAYGVVYHSAFRRLNLYRDDFPSPSPPTDIFRPADVPVIDASSVFTFDSIFSLDQSRAAHLSWLIAVLVVKHFQSRDTARAEIQFHSLLWVPLLNCALGIPFTETLISELELSLKAVLPEFPTLQCVDYAVFLSPMKAELEKACKIPFLFVEVSSHEVSTDQDHKDFRKMTTDMAAALIAKLGVVRHAALEEKRKLRIYGLFVGGYECIPCLMVPQFDGDNSKRASMMLYSENSWRFNLRDGISSGTLNPPSYSGLVTTAANRQINDIESFVEGIDQAAAQSVRKGVPIFSFSSLSEPEITSRLRPLFGFCADVREYSKTYSNILQNLRLIGDPGPYPSQFPRPPSSRKSHSSNTPAKDRSSSLSKVPRAPRSTSAADSVSHTDSRVPCDSRTRAVSVEFRETAEGVPVVLKRKRCSSKEEFVHLRQAQGDGIVRLLDCQDLGGQGIILMEERLDQVQFDRLSEDELGVVMTRLVIDGLQALETLSYARVLHRDISPNNLMYSFGAQGWKLTDFDGSCSVSDPNIGIVCSDLIGTDGFIAPEVVCSRTYSGASDMWSLGRTIEWFLHQVETEYYSRRDCGHEFDCIIVRLLLCAKFMSVEDPSKRSIDAQRRRELAELHAALEERLRSQVNALIRCR